MRTRQLRTGLTLTELGLGASQMGNLGREVTDDDAAQVFQTAWDGGIRYFDTAPHYGLGLSERRLGRLLAGVPREEFVLSSKVGRLLEPNPDPKGSDTEGFAVPDMLRRRWDFSRDGVLRSIEASLDRLGVDRLDVVYLHDPDDHWEQASGSGVPALVELREQGVINAVGVGMNDSTMLAEFVRRTDVDLVMCANRYTLLEQPAADDLLPLALAKGVGVVIAGVFNSGLLARPRPPVDAQYDYRPAPPELLARANQLADVCEAHGVNLPTAALNFPLRHPAVVSVMIGVRSAAQATAALDGHATEVPEDLWRELSAQGFIALEDT
ncbi:aldo/keto reductase [Tessaracoccus terricola]